MSGQVCSPQCLDPVHSQRDRSALRLRPGDLSRGRVVVMVALLPVVAVVAHILFAGDRRLDEKMSISCDSWGGPTYRKAFRDGWRLASDPAACEHCKVHTAGPCGHLRVAFIYCPSNSVVVGSHQDSLDDVIVDRCV